MHENDKHPFNNSVDTRKEKREKDKWGLGASPQGNFSCNSKFLLFKNRVNVAKEDC